MEQDHGLGAQWHERYGTPQGVQGAEIHAESHSFPESHSREEIDMVVDGDPPRDYNSSGDHVPKIIPSQSHCLESHSQEIHTREITPCSIQSQPCHSVMSNPPGMHDMKAPESDPLRGPPCSLKNPSLGTPSGDFVTNLPPHTDPFFSTSQNPQNVPMDVDSEFSTPTYTCGAPLQMMPPVGTPGGAILASPSQGNLWASGPGMIPVDPPPPGERGPSKIPRRKPKFITKNH